MNQKNVAIMMRGKCSLINLSRFPQLNMNDVSPKYGTVSTNVHAQPHFTKYTLKILSDREKYDFGNGAKSPIADITNKLPKYNATFKFTSKKMTFLHKWSTISTITSRTDVGGATGRVPFVSPRCTLHVGRKFMFVELLFIGFRFVAMSICWKISLQFVTVLCVISMKKNMNLIYLASIGIHWFFLKEKKLPRFTKLPKLAESHFPWFFVCVVLTIFTAESKLKCHHDNCIICQTWQWWIILM